MTTISLEQLGLILNATGLVVPLVGSMAISWQYRFPFFRYWTLAYLSMAATLPVLFFLELLGRPLSLAFLALNVYLLHVYFLFLAAFALQGQDHGRAWSRVAWLSLVGVNGLLAITQSFLGGAALITLMSLVAHSYMGYVLWRLEGDPAGRSRRWLAAMIIGMGAWGLTYPLLPPQAVWIGYVVAGLLHLLVGVGMIVLLLAVVSAELHAQNQELKKLDTLKSHFIATVSHELRTPLTIIKGAAGLLVEQAVGPLEASQLKLVRSLASHADRLTNLVCDLLDLSRIEIGHTAYRLEPAELGPLVMAAVAAARPAYEEKGIRLAIAQLDGYDCAAVDRDRFHQVVEQLLSNGLKFTTAPGEVTVSLVSEGDALRLTVRDTGKGIPASHLERIFARFYQVDNSSTREVDGLGLGLAISRAIIEDGHGGRIWAESAPGEGATFHVQLRRVPAGRRALHAS